MNKSEIGNRLASRLGLNKVVAKEAVDDVFVAIGEALANGEEVRIAGFGDVCREEPGYPYRAQPADRRGADDTGFEDTVI